MIGFSFFSSLLLRLAFLAGLILSIVSALDLCTEECKSSHEWTLFGIPFGLIGILFFSVALILSFIKRKEAQLILQWMIFGALGSEVMLILFQKSHIGHFCPICLAIAGLFLFCSLFFISKAIQTMRQSFAVGHKGDIMRDLRHGVFSLSILLMGFLITFIGLTKTAPLEAMRKEVKDEMAFGNLESPVQIFLFTDWACPACRSLEKKLQFLLPTLTKEARFTFVDFAVHPETLNFSPYNLSFMINNKSQYLTLRDGLTELSLRTKAPTDEAISKMAAEHGAKFHELPYSQVSLGLQYWKSLGDQFAIDGTPILVIVNPTLKKGKKLSGIEEITETNIQKAISSLKN